MRIPTGLALTLLLAGLTGCGSGSEALAAEPINEGFRFTVDIDGRPAEDVISAIEGLGPCIESAEALDPTTGLRTARPAGPKPTTVKFELSSDPGRMPAIAAWVKETYDGKDARKDITINILDAAGAVVRTFSLKDCFPVRFELHSVESSNPDVLHWTLEVRVNRWEAA